MPTYSYSRLNSYENCPLQYKFNYIDKVEVKKTESIEAFLGKIVHDVFKDLYDGVKSKNIHSLEELNANYERKWKERWNDSVYINKRNYSRENYFNTGKKAIAQYYGHYYPFDKGMVMATEMRVNFRINNKEEYKFTGIIDRIDKSKEGVFEIHDYKTGNSLPSQKDLDKDRQLGLYQIGIQSLWSEAKNVELIWHYVNYNMEMRLKKTGEQLIRIQEDIEKLINNIENNVKNNDMPAKESGLCNWCDFQSICPKRKNFFTFA